MQAQKNLPQPLLGKEGRKKRHYLSGSGTSSVHSPGTPAIRADAHPALIHRPVSRAGEWKNPRFRRVGATQW